MNDKHRWVSLGRWSRALLALSLLAGCAPTKISLKSNFWENKSPKIGVAIAKYPAADAYKAGAQGLLDMAINGAMSSGLHKYLATLETAGLEGERKHFIDELGRRGFSAVEIVEPVDVSNDKAIKASLAAIQAKEKIDLVIVLSVERWGTLRKYYGFIPLGAPVALFDVKGRMFDVSKNNSLVWQTVQDESQCTSAISKPWDQEPLYPNLTQAMNKAMRESKSFLFDAFFGPGTNVSQIPAALETLMLHPVS